MGDIDYTLPFEEHGYAVLLSLHEIEASNIEFVG